MSNSRRFLVAPSLARLIGRERKHQRVTEGHFHQPAERSLFIQIRDGAGELILRDMPPRGAGDEIVRLPSAQAEALLDVSVGRVDYTRSVLTVGSREIGILSFNGPSSIDLITVEFKEPAEAAEFQPSGWFGPEVSAEPAYQSRTMALEGSPDVTEVPLTNAALNSLLDDLEDGRPESHLEPSRPAVRQEQDPAVGEDEASRLDIEDSVIRELALALRPQRS